ncbi:MAG: hypothetical protein COA58_09305 [Bacteroidetes bacterium]|nr:MAG: hypothetical protein COA58_09305 [Bacteroidota bacterium]
MLDSNNQDTSKFTLEGSIHGKPISTYIQEQIETSRRKPRIIIAVLSVIATSAFIWGAVSQYRLQSQHDEVIKLHEYKNALHESLQSAESLETIKDSMENTIYRLKTENDLLMENTEPPLGVFFEVQIGSFSHFNLDSYNKNLANLRQEKYDGKTKFLLGRFKSFKKALVFEHDLKRMGIINAFIVGRIDDQIVTYKEALEAINQSNK